MLRRVLRHPATPIFLAALVAFANAAFDLERRSMWADEAESLRFSQSFAAMVEDWNAFFYYVVLLAIRRGELVELFCLRLPSALAFAAIAGGAVAIFARLRPSSGIAARLWLGVAVAAHPLLLTHAQDARGYELGAALLVLATLALLALLESGRWRHVAVAAPLAVAAVYCHLLVLVVVAVFLAAAFVFAPARRVKLLVVGAAIAAGCAPIAYVNLFASAANRLWWVRKPTGRILVAFFGELGGGWGPLTPLGWAFIALLVACAALRVTRAPARRVLFLAAALPVLLGVARSFWSPTTMPKFWLFCVPLAAVWAAAVLDESRHRAALALAGAVTAVWIAGSVLNHRLARNEGFRDAYELVRAEGRPGDRVWLPFVNGPFLYYAAKDGLPGLVPIGPCLDWVSPITACKRRFRPTLRSFVRGRGRVWIITNRGGYQELEALKGIGLRLVFTRQILTYPFKDLYADPRGGIVQVDLFEKDR